MLFLSVRGVFDYAGPASHSRLTRPAVLPSTYIRASASWNSDFSKLNNPAHRYLCLRFEGHLAMPDARLEAKMDSLSPFL